MYVRSAFYRRDKAGRRDQQPIRLKLATALKPIGMKLATALKPNYVVNVSHRSIESGESLECLLFFFTEI